MRSRFVIAGLVAAVLIGGIGTAFLVEGPSGPAQPGFAAASVSPTPAAPATVVATLRQLAETTAPAGLPISPTIPPGLIPRPTPGSSWQPDPAFFAAKMSGRVGRDAAGQATLLEAAATPSYPTADSLNTSWSGLIQEPPRTGTDDRGAAYTDFNYSGLCGAGAAAVTLYYWPASVAAVKTRAGSFTEPINWGSPYHATTYWKATGPNGYGRGMIMYLSETLLPTPDKGASWWQLPGLIDWTARPAATNVANLTDGLNWEASGGKRLDYFYVAVPASSLKLADLQAFVRADIGLGVPMIVAARTSNGTVALPFWSVKSTARAVNHFVAIVGYDDAARTFSVMDTCGTTCNDKNTRGGVRAMSQSDLFALIVSESDNDGVIW